MRRVHLSKMLGMASGLCYVLSNHHSSRQVFFLKGYVQSALEASEGRPNLAKPDCGVRGQEVLPMNLSWARMWGTTLSRPCKEEGRAACISGQRETFTKAGSPGGNDATHSWAGVSDLGLERPNSKCSCRNLSTPLP